MHLACGGQTKAVMTAGSAGERASYRDPATSSDAVEADGPASGDAVPGGAGELAVHRA